MSLDLLYVKPTHFKILQLISANALLNLLSYNLINLHFLIIIFDLFINPRFLLDQLKPLHNHNHFFFDTRFSFLKNFFFGVDICIRELLLPVVAFGYLTQVFYEWIFPEIIFNLI